MLNTVKWPKVDEYPEPPPVVIVEWVDSQRTGGWQVADDVREMCRDAKRLACRSAGFLYHVGPHSLTLAQSVGNAGQMADAMTIPRSAVRSIDVLWKAPRK